MTLKIQAGHLQYLRDLIQPLDNTANREIYKAGKFVNADKVQDLYKRYRWDLFWQGLRNSNNTDFLTKVLYSYLNDAHIDNALKYVVKPL